MIKALSDINLDKSCRICLAEQNGNGEMYRLFPEEGKNNGKVTIPLCIKIMSCAAVQVLKNDNLPQAICIKCMERLNEVCQFRDLIEDSDAKLREFIKVKNTTSDGKEDKEEEMQPQNHELIDDKCVGALTTNLPDDEAATESDETPSENENDKTISSPRGKSNPQHKSDLYICDTCPKSYKTLSSLRTHQKTHNKKNLKCPDCDKVFAYRRLLLQHKLVHTEVRYFLCSQCGKSFKTKGQLNVHARRHFNNRPFECKYCDKKFFQVSHRNQHMRLHTDERPYLCDICKKTFRNQTTLKGHIRMHNGIRPYECAICLKKFSLKTSLKNHIRLHSGEKPFTCEYCHKQFALSSSLKIHLKIHSDDNVNICLICGKKFSNAIHLEEHARTHGDKRDFICPTCGKGFKQSAGLTIHMKTHNPDRPYKCDLCDKSFVMRQTFDVHYRRHSGIKPYKCEVCGKCFRQGSTLRTHLSVHTGIRPHNCTCGKSFSQKSLYEKHLAKCIKESKEESEIVYTQNPQIPFESVKLVPQVETHSAPTYIIQMVDQMDNYVPVHYQIL